MWKSGVRSTLGGDHWNRTSPIIPYEGIAQTIYARSPGLVLPDGYDPTSPDYQSGALPLS